MKHFVVLFIGVAIGVGGSMYVYDAKVKAATNAQLSQGIAQGATAAQNALKGSK
jgi:hypothetical protein